VAVLGGGGVPVRTTIVNCCETVVLRPLSVPVTVAVKV